MADVSVVTALFVPHDHRDRVQLDDQILGQPACLSPAAAAAVVSCGYPMAMR